MLHLHAPQDHEFALREVKLLQLVNHKNVVKLLEAYQSQSGRLYLVFEYVENTVLQLIRLNRQGMPPAQVKSVLWQVLQAVAYLHKKKVGWQDLAWPGLQGTDCGGACHWLEHLSVVNI